MKKLKDTFTKFEKLLFFIIIASFIINALILGILYLLNGEVPQWLLIFVMPLGLYYILVFFVYVVRIYLYFTSERDEAVQIWRSILGVFLSILGLLFAFLNMLIITLANIW